MLLLPKLPVGTRGSSGGGGKQALVSAASRAPAVRCVGREWAVLRKSHHAHLLNQGAAFSLTTGFAGFQHTPSQMWFPEIEQ